MVNLLVDKTKKDKIFHHTINWRNLVPRLPDLLLKIREPEDEVTIGTPSTKFV